MKNYKMILQYEGTRYQGWQKQVSTSNTIQGKLEDILSKMAGYPVEIQGSGRTDAGVHALRQVANFKLRDTASDKQETSERQKALPARVEAEDIRSYVNQYLPEDIRVLEVEEVPERFHSRLNAKEKIYCYRIHHAEVVDVFTRRYTYHYPQHLNLKAMRGAAKQLCGTHDFKAFCTKKKLKKSTIRTIYEIKIDECGDEIRITYRGDGFLYHMVRIMTGTLLEIGSGTREIQDIQRIFDAGIREEAGELVPGCGLALVDVIY
ncbi:MAG TPA: tRNA pseudouridine(38-40) synthase TruA [Lachnospiraceae bacterium]|jgi:tRNA pseudouridine38-40 synthase|nr:tRNA pseudouridine(38-40) synthase TruA [Lachnospiraceae bacterium]